MKTSHQKSSSLHSIRAAAFETLESRQLMSVSLNPVTHVLTVTGTPGNDAISVNLKMGNVVVSQSGTANKLFAVSKVSSIVVNGGAGADSIRMGDNLTLPTTLNGGIGNDFLRGGIGKDTLNGNEGNDTLDGSGGSDILNGGSDTDTVDYSARTSALNLSVDGVANDGWIGSSEIDNIGLDVEVVKGGSGPDQLSGNDFNNPTLYGNGGDDVINSGKGSGTSNLYGGSGKDKIYAYGKSANIYAGSEDDFVSSACYGFTIAKGEQGNDTILGGLGGNSLSGGDDNDVICGFGDQMNFVYGDAGNDKLYAGGTFINSVNGGSGDDQLFGADGTDTLNGDAGEDILVSIGGGQSDTLTGGGDFDTFWCDAEVTEKITDPHLVEILVGSIHRVDSFINGPSRELHWQDLADPKSYDYGSKYQPGTGNFVHTNPLFSSKGPTMNDIRQGMAGDCQFLASLSGTAKNNPGRIKQTVVDLGDATFAVQFKHAGQTYFVRVDGDLPVYQGTTSLYYAGPGEENCIWVPIVEKAWASFRNNDWSKPAPQSYDVINGGGVDLEFEALGSTDYQSIMGSDQWATLNNINSALAEGRQVSISTTGMPSNSFVNGAHAYMVDHVNYQSIDVPFVGTITVPVSIVLRNPWGRDGNSVNDGNPDDGMITVSGDEFWANLVSAMSAHV